jgi:L-malate glycosyltransferase
LRSKFVFASGGPSAAARTFTRGQYMHIVLIPSWYDTPDKPWRGTFFRDQALCLLRHGVQVGLVFVERRSLSHLGPATLAGNHFQVTFADEEGIPTMRMKGWSTFAQTTVGSLLWATLMRNLLRSYVTKQGLPDIIHGHAAMWGGHAAMLVASDLGRPYIVTEHASSVLMMRLSRADRRRVATVYRNADRVIAVSGALKKSVDLIAGRRVAEVIPNAVDSAFFDLPARSRRSEPFVFLTVGDLVHSKRIDAVLQAFARLRKTSNEIRLVIVGTGKEEIRLRKFAASLGDSVEFTGALPRRMVRQRMWQANALVLPSDFETFGVVLIEALATGLPVVATRCGGPEEIVTPEVGALVPPDDEDALVAAMASTMARRFEPADLRDVVRRRFDYSVVAKSLCRTYEMLMHRRKVA